MGGTFLVFANRKGLNKVGKGVLPAQKLGIRAHLCDFSISHHQDQVSLGQEAQPVGYQDSSLF